MPLPPLLNRRPMRLALALAGIVVAVGSATGHDHAGPEHAAHRSRSITEQPFLDENAAAMTRMMADMDVAPTGDVDRDFVAMMIPHHQGAIEMAEAVLRHGKNETIRRLAQEIIVTQRDEIAAMRLAVADGSAAPAR